MNHGHRNRQAREIPSFSSTLLDAIYRSMDEAQAQQQQQQFIAYGDSTKKKLRNLAGLLRSEDMDDFQRSRLIMEEKVTQNQLINFPRKSAEGKSRTGRDSSFFLKSNPTYSDSSSRRGGFSSSEVESSYGVSSRSSTSTYSRREPKPISIITVSAHHRSSLSHQTLKLEGSKYSRTKHIALKFYRDLKKVKQKPISPGGRFSSFINSLFTSGGGTTTTAKNANISPTDEGKSSESSNKSSSSSFQRSCLITDPSSRRRSSSGTRRSVRFYPIEDYLPHGHKSTHEDHQIIVESDEGNKNPINEELKLHIMEKSRLVEEAARNLLKKYQKKVDDHERKFDMITNLPKNHEEIDNTDDDAESNASSDLFELDHLNVIGIDQRYREELPVYETTHLDTNRVIANGLVL